MWLQREDIVTLRSHEFLYRSTHWALIRPCFLIKTVWKLQDSSRRGCSDMRILFLYKKCSLFPSCLSKLLAMCSQSKFFISARARKKIAVLACSRMLAKTIHHPYKYIRDNMIQYSVLLDLLYSLLYFFNLLCVWHKNNIHIHLTILHVRFITAFFAMNE